MPAGEYDIYMEQGATFLRTITWQDAAEDPVNVTGFSARMQLRATENAPNPPELELSTTNGRISLGGAEGTISLVVAADDTALVDAGTYQYDLELESAGGVVTRLLEGTVTVDREVTRD